MSKVYMITVDHDKLLKSSDRFTIVSDCYYVNAANETDAVDHLFEQIKKYYFKMKLSEKWTEDPKRLGDRIIVGGIVTEEFVTMPVQTEDITPMAYVHKESGFTNWVDFDVTWEDVSCA